MTQNDDTNNAPKEAPTKEAKTIDMDGLDIPESDTDNMEEDAELIDGRVRRVEGAELLEGCRGEREEKGRRDALVDGILGDVD